MKNKLANWSFVKNEILKHWPRLSAVEVNATSGDIFKIIDLIQKNYGSKNFKIELDEIYIKGTNLIYAGSRDNSPERKLDANFSRINSPSEISSRKMNTPTIFEDEDIEQL